MSRLFVLTIPELVPGFHLAGIEAYAAEDVETAQGLITSWLDTGKTGLLAIDNSLLSALDHVTVRRLEASSDLLFVPIPGGIAAGVASSRRAGRWRA